ncbi:MAG: hypothetical protein M3342_08885 [Bacteroidota bacterium]|nr:hypothetical protein [Bacteroidota bacterium]
MAKKMRSSALQKLVENHVQNPRLAFVSERAAVTLAELETFIKEAKNLHNGDFDAVQIFFVRFPIDEAKTGKKAENIRIKSAGNNLTQVSLIFAPANIKKRHPQWIVEPLKKGGSILTLPVCDPKFKNETGLCPPCEKNDSLRNSD